MRVRPGGSWLLRRSMRGRPRLTLAADVDVYFCDPHAPWQRGSNENTNRLLRQYEPPRVCRQLYSFVSFVTEVGAGCKHGVENCEELAGGGGYGCFDGFSGTLQAIAKGLEGIAPSGSV